MRSLYWKAGLCAALGGIGGALAYFISSPHLADVASQNFHPNYTLGSVFGWLSHGLLGAFIVASVAAFLGYEDSGAKGALLSGGVGLVLGAFAGYGSDALYDWLMIRSLGSGIGASAAFHLVWSLFVCSALSLAIFLATGAKAQRWIRCLAAAGISSVVSEVARQAVTSTLVTGMVLNALQNPSSFSRGDTWVRMGPAMLAEYCVIGIVLGGIFGIVEAVMKPARLRQVLGVKEWRTWALTADGYRLGSAEEAEIRVADGGLASIHAYLVKQNRQYCIQEAGSGLVVNGIPTPAHWLSDGDVIQLGSSTFFYGEGNPPEPDKRARTFETAKAMAQADPRLVDGFGNIYRLKPGVQVIGRDPAADIALTWDDRVSRRHAEIRVEPDRVIVSDLGSRNGTAVQGIPIQGLTSLAPNSQIQVGSTTLTYLS